jgi:hypothetical protein
MNPDLDITYEQHFQFLDRVRRTAQAEFDGFTQASYAVYPTSNYSDNPRIQAVYEQGFRDGLAKLAQDQWKQAQVTP